MKVLCVLLPHFPLRCEIRRHYTQTKEGINFPSDKITEEKTGGFEESNIKGGAARHTDIEGGAARRADIKGCAVVADNCIIRGMIVTYAVGSQKLVLDYSPELEGLQRDMPLQQALSRHGEVELVQADIPHYRSVFNELLDSLEEKSPLVEDFDLGQAYIGLDGMQLIYPDDEALVNSIKEVIAETPHLNPLPQGERRETFAVQMGIAEGKFLAYLAALYSPPEKDYRILAGNLDSFLKDLSCDVLPVSLKSKDKLCDFGLHTLGQVTALPPGPLQAQFGVEGKRIWELARGYDDTPLNPRSLEEVIEESTILSSVTVSIEALLVAWESLLVAGLCQIRP